MRPSRWESGLADHENQRKTIPSWAVIGTADQVLPPSELTFMAKRAGAHITDVNAGHLSMIADPGTVAKVIERAAKATS